MNWYRHGYLEIGEKLYHRVSVSQLIDVTYATYRSSLVSTSNVENCGNLYEKLHF